MFRVLLSKSYIKDFIFHIWNHIQIIKKFKVKKQVLTIGMKYAPILAV